MSGSVGAECYGLDRDARVGYWWQNATSGELTAGSPAYKRAVIMTVAPGPGEPQVVRWETDDGGELLYSEVWLNAAAVVMPACDVDGYSNDLLALGGFVLGVMALAMAWGHLSVMLRRMAGEWAR